MTTWVIRSGQHGERDQWCLAEGVAGGGWRGIPDLIACNSREDVRAIVQASQQGDSAAKIANSTGQLWGLRSVQPGDMIVLPLKSTQTIAFGVATSGYDYLASEPDVSRRHVVRVDWKRDDVPRSALAADLLYTLGAFLTIFRPQRNNSEARLKEVLRTGIDPDATGAAPPAAGSPAMTTSVLGSSQSYGNNSEELVVVPTLENIRDRVLAHVTANFREHALTELVADILRVRGFFCDVSPPGPDGGVDIIAGSGPLGLDSPTLIVEVKSSPTAQGVDVVRKLQGAMLSNRSDQGLLVAWGGITKEARRSIASDRLTMRVWSADEVLDQLFDVYDRLPADRRTEIPLKQAWVLDQEAG